MNRNEQQKGSILIIAILIVAILVIGAAYWSGKADHIQTPPPPVSTPVPITPPPTTDIPTPPVATSPSIQSMTPTSGHVGDAVTIDGSGFLSTNTVLFSGGPVNNTTMANAGTVLTFTVPKAVGADCRPMQACPMYERLITPGTYSVSVRNSNGTSDSVSFIVD